MNVGDRIKRIRILRGMTQKELGLAIGFPEKSADVRIAQYEMGNRNPKEEVIELMAKALHVKPSAISNSNPNTYINLMYNLLDMENTFGLHIDQIDGELCIRMDRSHKDYVRLFDMMLQWYEERKKGNVDFESSMAYEEWKLNYPPTIKR